MDMFRTTTEESADLCMAGSGSADTQLPDGNDTEWPSPFSDSYDLSHMLDRLE